MKRLLLFLTFLTLSFFANAQFEKYQKPNNSYGQRLNRYAADSALTPAYDTLASSPDGSIAFKNHKYYYKDTTWKLIVGGTTWGSIEGLMSNQPDLQAALNGKQNVIPLGTASQYFKGDFSLGTFSTDVQAVGDARYPLISHTHTSSHITDLTTVVRNLFSGGSGISYNPSTGQISWPGTGVITSLNGLNASAQTFVGVGNIAINSFGTAHTFTVPFSIDSIKKSNDSVYALKNGTWWFQYIVPSGGGTGTDSASYHTITPFSDSSGFTINRPNGTRDTIVFVPVTGAGGTGAGSSSLSALTAAVATNTINNANYTQTWQWNGLSATGLQLSSSSSAASGNKQKLINATLTGTNTNSGEQTYVIVGSNQHAGSGSVNVGVYGIADNGEANFAVWGQASGANTASAGVYGTNSGAGAAGKFSNTGGGPSIYTTQGNVGFGAYPNQKAILELWSTTQGFLMPRMSTAQRDAITSVPEGLMVYDLTVHKVSVYNGSSWKYLLYE